VIRWLLGIHVADRRLKRAALGKVPVANVFVQLVGMVLAATLVGWLVAGREPRAIASQPIE
jgi:hypothetical protein